MSEKQDGPTLGRELMLRAVPLAIVAASAWLFLDAPGWIWLLPLGVALLVLMGRALRLLGPRPASDEVAQGDATEGDAGV
ncbi:MAG: hypothetical protein ACP5G7_11665 [Anaerolineae bacterium]